MNLAAALLAPLALLVAAIGGDEVRDGSPPVSDIAAAGPTEGSLPQIAPEWPIGVVRSFEPDSAWQVHIERRMTIRVAPRSPVPVPHDMFMGLPQGAAGARYSERKVGNCLPVAAIAGVEPNGPNNLILFLRDRRMINAQLERSCLARSFYSGFYLSHGTDGNLCVNRDTLLSRSGTACKLTRIRLLVEDDD